MAAARRKTLKQDQTHVLTTGTTIRFESPQSTRRNQKSSKAEHAVVVIQEAATSPVSGFVSFLREFAIVGLAIGFVIATQSQTIIKQFTTSFIDPLYALLFNGGQLSANTFTLTWQDRSQVFTWGAFVYTLANFLFVLGALYIVVKFFKLDKFDKKKDEVKK